jgi:hypothetical protein
MHAGALVQDYRAAFAGAMLSAMVAAAWLLWPRLREPPPPAGDDLAPSLVVQAAPSASSSGAHDPGAPAAGDAGTALCPEGMQLVSGVFCPFVAHRCATYLGAEPDSSGRPEGDSEERRCLRYHDDLFCEGRPRELSFCIDRFEYPNLEGVKPAAMVSYHEAKQACAADGKRLCEADEWMLACEGARTWPYPYGIERTAGACNVDRRPLRPDPEALASPRDVSVEIERVDQRMPSGALTGCRSSYGIRDTTGNLAEWVHDREGDPSQTVLAGGGWGRVRATCRSLDDSRDADYRAPETGFRCCGDALDGRRARRVWPGSMRLPKRRRLLEEGARKRSDAGVP